MKYSDLNIEADELVEIYFDPASIKYRRRPWDEREVESLEKLFSHMQDVISEEISNKSGTNPDLLAVLRDALRLLELLFDETDAINRRVGEDE